MGFITAPDFRIASIDWVLRRPAQINVSGFTGRRTVVANPWHGKWVARVQLVPMTAEEILAFRSFIARAKGSINTFRLYASEGPQNENGGVTASATAAAGATTMTLSGTDVPMKDGQFVTVNGQLLLLTANQAGSTITFEPPLRAQVSSGTTVATRRPYVLAYLTNSDSGWKVNPGRMYNASFDVEEAILETDGAAPESASAPFNTVAPAVTGTPTQGQTLSVSNGTWLHSPSSYARQWLRGGVNIYGATGATYVLTAGDVGADISARVTATNATGSGAAVSNIVGPVATLSPPVNTVLPVITGTIYLGATLTVSNGTWTGSPSSYARQWKRDGVNIAGATGSTYVLVAADVGADISAVVTATNAYGSTPASAAAVGPIDNFALLLDFANGDYRALGVDYGAISSFPGYSYTRSGQVRFVNGAGAVETFAADVVPIPAGIGYEAYGAATNILLNAGGSGGLSTQSVTTTATPYTLSFIGTGTVTLSGTSTAGPLVGTGANDRVSLTFTPTAGTLTLTVTGSVTYAGLIAGSYSDGGPIIATAGATASIGDSVLTVTDDLGADADQVFFVKTTLDPSSVFNARIVYWGEGGGSDNRVDIYQNGLAAQLAAVAYSAGAGYVSAGVAYTAGTPVTAVVRRLGGNWRFGVVISGVLTWADAGAAGSLPVIADDKVAIGFYRPGGQSQPNDALPLVARRIGTFTSDADVIAAVA